ncbi:hypothetical protein Hanom_Chr03g00183921 [Helianthus anomalus]
MRDKHSALSSLYATVKRRQHTWRFHRCVPNVLTPTLAALEERRRRASNGEGYGHGWRTIPSSLRMSAVPKILKNKY